MCPASTSQYCIFRLSKICHICLKFATTTDCTFDAIRPNYDRTHFRFRPRYNDGKLMYSIPSKLLLAHVSPKLRLAHFLNIFWHTHCILSRPRPESKFCPNYYWPLYCILHKQQQAHTYYIPSELLLAL